ncbi:MAG: DNA processing protein [Parcubacteria group bacterium Gr01-1014_66]|nr:MAG: DNA processing protein [Parcubacteria group bacterium Gr01-1014_66]
MQEQELISLHAFNHIPGVSSSILRLLKNHLGDFKTAWRQDARAFTKIDIPDSVQQMISAKRPFIDPHQAWDALKNEKIWLVCEEDEEYPKLLHEIPHKPYALYGKGDHNLLSSLTPQICSIAIVGTRRPTRQGIEITNTIARDLACAGCIIISGLAQGIDATAHRGALDAGGKTIGILGSGMDRASFFPQENWQLAERMAAEGGVVLSEHRPGVHARAYHFPQRNRIISGCARGALVVEAREKSGARITARFALEQNRDIFAIPGSPFSPTAFGPNQLIRDGAKLVTSATDILQEYGIVSTRTVHDQQTLLSPDAILLLPLLEEPTSVDIIKTYTNLAPEVILATLSLLELQGAVRHLGQGMYQKI